MVPAVIRGAKRNRTIRSWELFCTISARQSDPVNRRFTQDAAIGRGHQEKADKTKDRQQVHEQIPTELLLLAIIESTPRAIRKGLAAKIRRPTLRACEYLRHAVLSCHKVPPQARDRRSHNVSPLPLEGRGGPMEASDLQPPIHRQPVHSLIHRRMRWRARSASKKGFHRA